MPGHARSTGTTTCKGDAWLTGTTAQPLADLSRRLSRALRGKRWYVFGARAAIHFGSARGTVDVDISLALDGQTPESLIALLAAEGFDTRIPDWEELLHVARVLLLTDRTSGIEVDLVMTGPGLEEEFHSRARSAVLSGIPVPVISAEDLVIGKVLAGRTQDLQDVGAVLAATGTLDVQRITDTLRSIERALDREDLVDEFVQLLGNHRRD